MILSVLVSCGFNPHTHTGCDAGIFVSFLTEVVSIHTPIQGVTMQVAYNDNQLQVSIHTPIQGVTTRISLDTSLGVFQSTHPYRV